MKKCIPAMLLAATMLIATIPAAAYHSDCLVPQKNVYSAPFADTTGIWCDSYVRTCYETGLIEGFSKTAFKPDQSLTCAQILVITARLHELLNGGDGEFDAAKATQAWYTPYYTYLKKAGITMPFPFDNVELNGYAGGACTRWNFVGLLEAVLPDTALEKVNSVTVIPDIEPDEALLKFYNAGILNGKDEYGTFDGDSTLTRGQASAFLARIVDPSQRLAVSLTPFDLCRDVLEVAPETVLLTVNGTDVTAEQFAYSLVSCLLAGSASSSLAEAEKDAIYQCKYTLTFYLLAQQHGITMTEDERASAKQSAASCAGSLGVTENGWLWSKEETAVEREVRLYYIAHYGVDERAHSAEPAVMWNDFSTLMDTLTVDKTPEYLALDLSTIRTRALNSPLCGFKL